jgi:hypothetical protein
VENVACETAWQGAAKHCSDSIERDSERSERDSDRSLRAWVYDGDCGRFYSEAELPRATATAVAGTDVPTVTVAKIAAPLGQANVTEVRDADGTDLSAVLLRE